MQEDTVWTERRTKMVSRSVFQHMQNPSVYLYGFG
jgi:hypothetical protein